MMIIQQLISNANFPNPSQLAFARKRDESTRRDASYFVESHNDEYSILLNVNLSGNILTKVSRKNGYISHGRHEVFEDWEDVKWSDSNSLAVIRTDLTFEDLQGEIQPEEIMKSYLEAIANHGDAMCIGGYQNWRLQVQMLVDMMAQKTGHKIELDLIPSMSTCPGMEYIRPWHPPSCEAYIIEGEGARDYILSEDDQRALQKINEKCMPRSSTILLHPPFMIRAQSREIFLSS